MDVNLSYGFNEDEIIKLQRDLNHLLTHLDSQNVRRLYTERCEIKSEGGETVIDGPLLTMYDFDALTSQASTNLRLKMGYEASTSNFVFKLFNSTGVETLSLDANGNAIFSGNVNTSQDINVGNNIYLGKTGTTNVLKGIYFNSTVPIVASSTGYTTPFESSDGRTGLFWDAFYGNYTMVSTAWASISGLTKTRLAVGAVPTSVSYLVKFKEIMEMTTDGILLGTLDSCGAYLDYIWFNSTSIQIATTKKVLLGSDASTGNVYLYRSAVSTNLVASKGWAGFPGVQIAKTADQAMSSGGIVTFDSLALQIGDSTDIGYSSSDNGITINSSKVKAVEVDLRLWVNRGEGIYSWVMLRKNSTNIASGIMPARMVGQETWITHNLRTRIAAAKGDVFNSYCAFSGAASSDNIIPAGTYPDSCILSVRSIENY
jgi:hypothetical protein